MRTRTFPVVPPLPLPSRPLLLPLLLALVGSGAAAPLRAQKALPGAVVAGAPDAASATRGDDRDDAAPPGQLFENVVRVLQRRFYDRDFRRDQLPRLAAEYRAAARAAADLDEERAVVHAVLGRVPASHLALYSTSTYRALMRELSGEAAPTFGFDLEQRGGSFFVRAVLDGGAAAAAGLLRGDRVLAIDGVASGRSARLDWRADDAALDDQPVRRVRCAGADDTVRLHVERQPGERLHVDVAASQWSALAAAKAGARVLEHGGRRIGYVHFWFVHMSGLPQLLGDLLAGPFAGCDGLVLDLRGRGGSGGAVMAIVRQLQRAQRPGPVAALIDRDTRSAKEVLAHELDVRGLATLVGERTAGAVIPATFADVGQGCTLMFPSFTLGRYTELLEGRGVEPDVPVRDDLPFAAGADPILDAALAHVSAGV